jgi:hypothetical protein
VTFVVWRFRIREAIAQSQLDTLASRVDSDLPILSVTYEAPAVSLQGLYRQVLGYERPAYQVSVMDAFFEPLPDHSPQAKAKLQERLQTEAPNLSPQALIALKNLVNTKSQYSFAMNFIYHSLQPGWVHAGCKEDVPKEACYVGKHGRTYVWVTKDGLDALTGLTIAVLDVATTDTAAQGGEPPKPMTISLAGPNVIPAP